MFVIRRSRARGRKVGDNVTVKLATDDSPNSAADFIRHASSNGRVECSGVIEIAQRFSGLLLVDSESRVRISVESIEASSV